MIRSPWLVQLEREVAVWEEEVAHRNEIAQDPVAQGISWAAKRLRGLIARLESPTTSVTPAQFGAAQQPPVSDVSVRKWCRLGQVPGAELTAHGWRIPIGAVRVRTLVVDAAALTAADEAPGADTATAA